jgi:hypothetical protein
VVDAEAGGQVSLPARLAFLADAGVITATARDLTEASIREISARLLPLDAEDGASLVTHIAMALTRVERGEPEPELPQIAADELVDRPEERALAHDLAVTWEASLGRPIPDSEVSYVAIHLAALRLAAA